MPLLTLRDEPLEFSLGRIVSATNGTASDSEFVLGEKHLGTHMAVLGSTGTGKSKFLELLMRMMIYADRGFCLIDPYGDLTEDLLVYAHRRRLDFGTDDFFHKIHYLEPSYATVFGYDPFRYRRPSRSPPRIAIPLISPGCTRRLIRSARSSNASRGRPIRGDAPPPRWLRNVLYAVGVAIDDSGRHLPLSDALVLLNTGHERNAEVFRRIAPRLDPDIRADFDRYFGYRRDEDRMREAESTINRLRLAAFDSNTAGHLHPA